jgi:outer membrane protein
MKHRFFAALAAVCLFLAAPAGAEDLLGLYRQATLSDPQIQAAAARLRAVRETIPQSRGVLLPQLGVGGVLSRERFDPRNSNDKATYATNKRIGLDLRQTVFRYDQFIQLNQAESVVAQAEAEYAAAVQDLIIRVSEAYFRVLGAMDNLRFAIAERDANARLLEQAKQRFEVGLIAITDVDESQAGFDLARSRVIEAEGLLDIAYEELREITGVRPKELAVLEDEIPLTPPEPARVEEWVTTALEQNLSLVATLAALDVSLREIQVQRAGHLPTLDFTADYVYRDESFSGFADLERNDASVGLELNLPVYQGGIVSSQVREARALFQEAQEQVVGARRSAERQTRDSYRGVITDIATVEALEQALISTRTALRAQEAGLEVGTRTTVDVLNAQSRLYEAERDRARARYTYLLNGLRLERAAGTLADEDLEEVNRWLK